MKKTTHLVTLITIVFVLLTACDFSATNTTYSGDEVFEITAEQQSAKFTFTVEIDTDKATALDSMEEVFLWIKPDFDYNDYQNRYYPLHRQKLTSAHKQQGEFRFTFDFAQAARSWNTWWLNDYQIDGQDADDLAGFSIIASDGYRSGWQYMRIDNTEVEFENSYPAGLSRSKEVFTVDLDSAPYERIVSLGTQAGLYISDEVVEDDSNFYVRLQLEQGSKLNFDGGFIEPPVINFDGGSLILGSVLDEESNSAIGRYVWKVYVNSSSTPPNNIVSTATGMNYINISGNTGYWQDTKDIIHIGPANVLASDNFDDPPVYFDSWDFTNLVTTNYLHYPYYTLPDKNAHTWSLGTPEGKSAYEGLALGTGENGNINESYPTMRNDFLEIPIDPTVTAAYGSYDAIWVVFDLYSDLSGSWDDKLSIQYGGYYDLGTDKWDFIEAKFWYEQLGSMYIGDPTINNGWKTVGVNLDQLQNGAPIRFHFQSDNIFDGRTGALIDNIRILGRTN